MDEDTTPRLMDMGPRVFVYDERMARDHSLDADITKLVNINIHPKEASPKKSSLLLTFIVRKKIPSRRMLKCLKNI